MVILPSEFVFTLDSKLSIANSRIVYEYVVPVSGFFTGRFVTVNFQLLSAVIFRVLP